jgi:peptide/nickel transport system ATP-binding protein
MLEIEDLCVEIRRGAQTETVVDGVSLGIGGGEIVGVVGESGAGKSLTARAVLRLLPRAASVRGGQIVFDGVDLLQASASQLRSVRGAKVGMILQDPMSSLDPTMKIGDQVSEPLRLHGTKSGKQAMRQAEDMLNMVGLPDARRRLDDYPHLLSGGMRQRVAIAMALICRPRLLIADEPTTALDVTIQAQILDVLRSLREQLGLSILLISHDIGVVGSIADRIAVMYAGQVVEDGPAERVLAEPGHRYTEALLDAFSDEKGAQIGRQGAEPGPAAPPDSPIEASRDRGCRFAWRCPAATLECVDSNPPWVSHEGGHWTRCINPPRAAPRPATTPSTFNGGAARSLTSPGTDGPEVLRVEGVSKEFPIARGTMQRRIGVRKALQDVSFSLRKGETLAVIGESGCGKTTLARVLVGLERPTSGRVFVQGRQVRDLSGRSARQFRGSIQLMFQDPYGSLDPRMKVGKSLAEPMAIQGLGSREERIARVLQLLQEVGLDEEAATLYPHEFSGGQRQRLAFARSIIVRPAVVVADEPVSALDVSIRAQVLDIMRKLQFEHGIAYVVISHDISIVRRIADRTAVMYAGRVVEIGPTESVLGSPMHPYTQGLLASVPTISRGATVRATVQVGVRGELSDEVDVLTGCPFRTRCPKARSICQETAPQLEPHDMSNRLVECHFPGLEAASVRRSHPDADPPAYQGHPERAQ